MTQATQHERCWIILSEDGRHVTIGRHSDPTEEELARAADGLRDSGLGGWLAVTEGVYYQPSASLSVMMVRPVVQAQAAWEDALAAFMAIRRQAVTSTKPHAPKLG